jgi:hypothetical protein
MYQQLLVLVRQSRSTDFEQSTISQRSTTTTTAPGPASPIDFSGKYSLFSVSFPNTRDGFALVGGFPRGSDATQVWLDHTMNGGRSWRSQSFDSPQSFIAFNSSTVGWAYPNLSLTTDGGSHWTRVAAGRYVVSLAVSGHFTWFVSQRSLTANDVQADSHLTVAPVTVRSRAPSPPSAAAIAPVTMMRNVTDTTEL